VGIALVPIYSGWEVQFSEEGMMTEEKLIDELWGKYHGCDKHGFRIMIEEAFAKAIHEALAAERRGCADTWIRHELGEVSQIAKDTSPKYQAILNAEPDTI
jgi:hypothetical protein